MVVDDDLQTVEAFRMLLESEGAVVDVATDGETALAQLTRQPPDLLLSDIGMPDMDGHQLMRRLREQTGPTEMLSIALSGFGRPSDVQAARAAGFDAHLTKPITLDNLISNLMRLRKG